MNVLDPDTLRTIDAYIDRHHDTFAAMGDDLYRVFEFNRRTGRVATQVRNLQQIVCSARRLADVEDFVKNQMGKESSENPKWREVGVSILEALSGLRKEADRYAGQDTSSPDRERRALLIRLRLVRGWMRAVVTQYLYRVALAQMEVKS